MRILWRRNARGLLDDSRPDKSDLSARLGNQNVAERSEAGRNAAKCRVRQNGNEGKFLAVMHGSGGRNFGHLHQREHAFLHASAAAGRHADQRNSALRGLLEGVSDFFAHDGTHRAAQKREIENDQHRLVASDAAKSGGYGLADSCLPASLLQTNAIGFVVRKSERIDGNKFAVQFTECPFIGEQRDSRARRHGQIMIASRADVEVRFQRGPRVNRAATGTLRRGRDGDFTSEHDSLLPGNDRNLKPTSGSRPSNYRRFGTLPLDEKLVTVIIELGRRRANARFLNS